MSIVAATQSPRFAVEIKWSDRAYDDWSELRGLREFAARHNTNRRPLVTTRTASGIGRDGSPEIEIVPTRLHCYSLGRNLLRANQR